MRNTLRWLKSVGVLLLGTPVLGHAQAVGQDHLVGTWLLTESYWGWGIDVNNPKATVSRQILTLRSDGTWQRQAKWTEAQDLQTSLGKWYVVGDSLWLSFDTTDTFTPKQIRFLEDASAQRFAVQGQQLLLGPFTFTRSSTVLDPHEFACKAKHYIRIDPSQPLPPIVEPPAPPPPTVKRSDLVGTWRRQPNETLDKDEGRVRVIMNGSSVANGLLDSLILNADTTWMGILTHTSRQNNRVDRSWAVRSGYWYLRPGDTLWLASRVGGGKVSVSYAEKVTIQNPQQFSVTAPDTCYRDRKPDVYKRVPDPKP